MQLNASFVGPAVGFVLHAHIALGIRLLRAHKAVRKNKNHNENSDDNACNRTAAQAAAAGGCSSTCGNNRDGSNLVVGEGSGALSRVDLLLDELHRVRHSGVERCVRHRDLLNHTPGVVLERPEKGERRRKNALDCGSYQEVVSRAWRNGTMLMQSST